MPKGHDSPGQLSRVGASEGELLLGRFRDANLVVSRRGVHEPAKGAAKVNAHSLVAARDWVGNDSGNGIQSNVTDAESPDEVINVSNVLLVGFGGK